jgi:MFS family permease
VAEYWHFMLAFGVLNGIGTSCLFTPIVASIGHFFRRRRGFATGLASTGSGIGGIIIPLMLGALLQREDIGWGWAVRIHAFMCLFLFVVANLLVKKRLPPAKNATVRPNLLILREKSFAFLTVGAFLLEFGLFIPMAYISSYALSQDFSVNFAYQALTILNGASVLGRILSGWWGDVVGPFNSSIVSLVITIFSCYALWLPFGHTTPGLILFCILFGFATGNSITIIPVCVGKLCHTQVYGRYYATCYVVCSIACLVAIPIGGSIVTASGGDYSYMIIFVGITQALALVAMYASKVAQVGWKPWAKF